MGKPGKRKRNPGVGIDFKRAKHRVGKKLPQAQNATDTSFKAGSIVLGTQSLAVDRQGLAVGSHNLTVKVPALPAAAARRKSPRQASTSASAAQELLSQVSHYSERQRRAAIQQLDGILEKQPAELQRQVQANAALASGNARRPCTLPADSNSTAQAGPLISKLAGSLVDSEAAVRKQAASLFQQRVFPGLPGSALQPFLPLIMAYVHSGLTQLASDIRCAPTACALAVSSEPKECDREQLFAETGTCTQAGHHGLSGPAGGGCTAGSRRRWSGPRAGPLQQHAGHASARWVNLLPVPCSPKQGAVSSLITSAPVSADRCACSAAHRCLDLCSGKQALSAGDERPARLSGEGTACAGVHAGS